jgi:hypothetical protein
MSEKGLVSGSFMSREWFSYFLIQYGNVFTFVLLGRRVTVALGVQGNNFILGGKSTVFNAEDAYKVRSLITVHWTEKILILSVFRSAASHDTYFWQGRRLRCC